MRPVTAFNENSLTVAVRFVRGITCGSNVAGCRRLARQRTGVADKFEGAELRFTAHSQSQTGRQRFALGTGRGDGLLIKASRKCDANHTSDSLRMPLAALDVP